ncbi:hypothetical protein MRX96_034740 [Rhipicephalus microplus]
MEQYFHTDVTGMTETTARRGGADEPLSRAHRLCKLGKQASGQSHLARRERRSREGARRTAKCEGAHDCFFTVHGSERKSGLCRLAAFTAERLCGAPADSLWLLRKRTRRVHRDE